MGTLYLGNADDDAPGMMDGALGANKDIEGNSWYSGDYEAASYQTPLNGGGDGVTWISPSLGGFKVGTSYFPGKRYLILRSHLLSWRNQRLLW